MQRASVNYSKRGQLKIQQMAFVLVALLIFFSLVFLFYLSIRTGDISDKAEDLREKEIRETIRKITGSPEFTWQSAGDCASCIDLDKVFLLSEAKAYEDFWRNVPVLRIERVYPSFGEIECTRQNYPDCDIINIVQKDLDHIADSTFVSLCRYDESGGHNRCELGKVVMGFETIA